MAAGLVSIGYEGRTAEELVALVAGHGVEVLADVRLTPRSRKPGLSRTRLSAALAEAGVGYVHLRPLGNPPENRAPFRTGDVAAGVRRYRELLRDPAASDCLDRLAGLVGLARSATVAVLCFERDHHRCHRQVVVEEVVSRVSGAGVTYA